MKRLLLSLCPLYILVSCIYLMGCEEASTNEASPEMREPVFDPIRSGGQSGVGGSMVGGEMMGGSTTRSFCGDVSSSECPDESGTMMIDGGAEAGSSIPGCGAGNVQGIVCAPNREPVVGAEVTISIEACNGQITEHRTQTNERGGYSLSGVSAGQGQVRIRAGSFEDQYDITVEADQLLDLSQGETCFKADTTRLAVITGDYDMIEQSISRLGFNFDAYCGGGVSSYGARALLGDPSLLSQYDVIFLNCGNTLNFTGAEGDFMKANLRAFVEGGGSVYASDLSAGLLDAVFPSVFSFNQYVEGSWDDDVCCDCVTNCPAHCGANLYAEAVDFNGSACMGFMPNHSGFCFGSLVEGYGEEGYAEATVLNNNLRNALGRDTISLHFDVGGWVELLASSPQVETLVGGDQPYMVRYTSEAGGRVIFTSFHNEYQPSEDLEKILRALIFEL